LVREEKVSVRCEEGVREAHDTGTRQGRGAWQGADAYKAKALRGL
jgi:hypothetical protein